MDWWITEWAVGNGWGGGWSLGPLSFSIDPETSSIRLLPIRKESEIFPQVDLTSSRYGGRLRRRINPNRKETQCVNHATPLLSMESSAMSRDASMLGRISPKNALNVDVISYQIADTIGCVLIA